ncbi:uncharacterized protein BO66DRAFT_376783 [Aspergillus aculeatinus CBS 121060]|uniref:Uncharacterized protein n=1 Tax=Aspergillus aculeatinus CBS 121060 TaxID=1448322 RepID=A0ACD1H524_9EURO|nr:hypothetical protein BO66DRAFT_376783 [Aspergillus aculeatinus CBS 121060]RAH68731.1 hypothetical protein BO66DRAFT_376783 [Aspergillus aculeatinus CBS 121060]
MASTTYTLEQVRSHNKKDDVWIILHNKVYNITAYLDDHPGGVPVLLEVAGLDATEAFEEIGHSDEARELLEPYLIGDLVAEDQAEAIEVYRPTFEKVSQVAAVDVRKRQRSTVGLLVKSLLAAVPLGLAAGLGYSVYSNGLEILRQPQLLFPHLLQEIHLPSGTTSKSSFWSGVGIGSALQISLTGALTIWLSTKLDAQESFASHKPYRTSRSDTLILKSALKSTRTLPEITASTTTATQPLDPKQWRKFQLIRKDLIAPNVYHIAFALPHPDDRLGLPTGQHIALRATINAQSVSRSYTPISNNSDLGRVELLIKVYDQGLMTQHLASMVLGQEIEIRGPKGAMKFTPDFARHIGMIAGGTGITPMYQIIRASLDDPSNNIQITLLYANNTEGDILLRRELDTYAARFPERFRVEYVLSRPEGGWDGRRGFVTQELIQEALPAPAADTRVFLCGPPPMIEAMKKNLVGLGYQQPGAMSKAMDQVFLF